MSNDQIGSKRVSSSNYRSSFFNFSKRIFLENQVVYPTQSMISPSMKSLKPVLVTNNRQGSLNRHSASHNTSLTNLTNKGERADDNKLTEANRKSHDLSKSSMPRLFTCNKPAPEFRTITPDK